MSNKRIYILGGVVLFLVIGAILVLIFGSEKKTSPPADNTPITNQFPVDNSTTQKPQSSVSSENPKKLDNIVIESDKGKVEIKDPVKLKKSEVTPNDYMLEENKQFAIFYLNYEDGPNFLISITDVPIDVVRKNAEEKFIEIININKEEACKLRVSLTVPMSVSESASGPDYHLSFCPDGKPFPISK